MESPLENSLLRCKSHLDFAERMYQKCAKRNRKTKTFYRIILSFFFARSWEMFHSLIVLIKEERVVDAAILLRSLCNMAIDLAYITRDIKRKEIEAIKYCIQGDRAQINIINANLKDFKGFDSNIELRKQKLEKNVKNLKKHFAENYPGESSWDYPRWISKRAEEAGGYIFMAYNLVYRLFSNIEHHNMFFGQDYVDTGKSEPILFPEKIKKSDLYRPEFLLYFFEWIFLMILKCFNWEYRLKLREEISIRIKKHKLAFKELMSVKTSPE